MITDKTHYSLSVYMNDDDDGIQGETFEKYVRIDYIIVAEEERGQGKGRQLVKDAVAEAKTCGLPIFMVACQLEQDTDLEMLCEFYESEGFEVHSMAGDSVVMEYVG